MCAEKKNKKKKKEGAGAVFDDWNEVKKTTGEEEEEEEKFSQIKKLRRKEWADNGREESESWRDGESETKRSNGVGEGILFVGKGSMNK